MYTSIKMVIPILPHFLKNAMFIFWRICRQSICVPNATSTPPSGSPQRINCEAVTAGTVFFPLETLHRKSGLQFAVLTRSAGVLPGDVVSLYFGCVRLNYPAYLAGSILGHAPGMAAATILGRQVSDPGEPGFWAAMGCGVAVALFSFLACGRVVRNHKTAPAPEEYKNET